MKKRAGMIVHFTHIPEAGRSAIISTYSTTHFKKRQNLPAELKPGRVHLPSIQKCFGMINSMSTETNFVTKLEEPDKLTEDRKSTRLNSSHVAISYAVFCS